MTDLIDQMPASRRLEYVAVNRAHALGVIDTAERHISTATVIADTDDHAMARTAVLAIEGLRVRPVGGAHRNTGMAAAAIVSDRALHEFDWLRQARNATEYPDEGRPTATKQDVAEAMEAASSIVAACAGYVRGQG